ncbi:uncharacterized protein Hap1MRO34_015744 [Clarias gariepinus]
MGTSNSRPNICKVTPKEEQPFHHAASVMMITAAQHCPPHQKIIQLPPLKQHVPQIFSSAPGLQNLDATPIHSIIKSHPPLKAKAWQPTESPAVSNVSDEHVSMVHTCPTILAERGPLEFFNLVHHKEKLPDGLKLPGILLPG